MAKYRGSKGNKILQEVNPPRMKSGSTFVDRVRSRRLRYMEWLDEIYPELRLEKIRPMIEKNKHKSDKLAETLKKISDHINKYY